MSEANKMLRDLGYKFEKVNNEFIIYKKDDENCYPYEVKLSFNKKPKTVVKYCELYTDRMWLTMQELQAINKKCEELRLDMKVREFLKDILNKKTRKKKIQIRYGAGYYTFYVEDFEFINNTNGTGLVIGKILDDEIEVL